MKDVQHYNLPVKEKEPNPRTEMFHKGTIQTQIYALFGKVVHCCHTTSSDIAYNSTEMFNKMYHCALQVFLMIINYVHCQSIT